MNNIKITYPYLLFVAIPLVVLSLVIFFLIPKAKRKRLNNILSLCLHIVLSFTLSLAFSDIQVIKSSNKTEMYIVVDCSDSEKTNVEKIDETVKNIYEKSASASASSGVVCFGENSFVLVKPGQKLKSVSEAFDSNKHPDFVRSASDISSALNFTKDLYTDGSIKKMVLVTDGVETDNSAIDTISTILNDNIALDAVYLEDTVSGEVSIRSVDYIDHCFTNREQTVKAMIQSSSEKNVKIDLTSSGELKEEKETTLAPGLNVITFYVKSEKAGAIDYQIEVKADSDTFKENNIVSFTQEYKDDFSVLFIGNTKDDLTAFKNIGGYTDNAKIDSYYDTANVPYKLESLLKYDEIVLDNINVLNLNHHSEFTENLNTAVYSYGKSLLTYGATYTNGSSEGIASYHDMLPVQYESDDAKALVLLIDCSGSMSSDDRLTIAKKGAIKCLDVLSDKDYVSIISFSDSVKIHQPMTSIKNKSTIINAINSISLGGGTRLGAGLRQAQEQVYNSKCEYKNVITLTDGQPSESDSELERIVNNMAKDNIVCSFINISSEDGVKILTRLSNLGNGTYYFCRTASGLIDVMLTSVSGEIGNTEINQSAQIQYRSSDDPVLSNVKTLPDLQGYNYCRIKGGSTTVLTVQYIKKDEKNNVTGVATIPLYAYWNFGKGKVSSFTSNLTSDWTKDFRNSTSGKTFLKNAIYQTLPDRSFTNLMDLTTSANGKTMGVSILVDKETTEGVVHVKATDPKGTASEMDLIYDYKNKTYNINLPVSEVGKYTLEATYSEKDASGNYQKVETNTFTFYYNFSKEYDVLPTTGDNTLLSELTRSSSGTLYANGSEYEYKMSDNELNQFSYYSTMMIFFLVSVIIYLADIFIRKTTFKKKNKTEVAE